MNPLNRGGLMMAALALATRDFSAGEAHAIGPGERKAKGGRPVPPPPNRQPPLRDDTWTAKRKAKARARRGW